VGEFVCDGVRAGSKKLGTLLRDGYQSAPYVSRFGSGSLSSARSLSTPMLLPRPTGKLFDVVSDSNRQYSSVFLALLLVSFPPIDS
jgi:hypothetical protein